MRIGIELTFLSRDHPFVNNLLLKKNNFGLIIFSLLQNMMKLFLKYLKELYQSQSELKAKITKRRKVKFQLKIPNHLMKDDEEVSSTQRKCEEVCIIMEKIMILLKSCE